MARSLVEASHWESSSVSRYFVQFTQHAGNEFWPTKVVAVVLRTSSPPWEASSTGPRGGQEWIMKTKRKTGSSGDTKEKLPERPVGSYSKYRSGRILRKLVPLFLSLFSFSCLTSSFPSLTNMQPSFISTFSVHPSLYLSTLFCLLFFGSSSFASSSSATTSFFFRPFVFYSSPSSSSFILFVPFIYPFLLLRFRPFLPRPLPLLIQGVTEYMGNIYGVDSKLENDGKLCYFTVEMCWHQWISEWTFLSVSFTLQVSDFEIHQPKQMIYSCSLVEIFYEHVTYVSCTKHSGISLTS